MAIYISNSIYLSALTPATSNRPLIGWHSVFAYNEADDAKAADPGLALGGNGGSNVWSPDTYSAWSVSNSTGSAAYGGIEVQVTESVNYFGISGHNFGSLGAFYVWQKWDAGAPGWENITDLKIPASDNRALIDYVDAFTPGSGRVRLLVQVPNGQTARVAHIKIGNIFKLQQRVWTGVTPAGMDTRTKKIGSQSYVGQHLGSVVISQGEGFSIQQEHNTVAFIRSTDMQNFFKHANQLIKIAEGPPETFFYAWRPDTHPTEVQYCGKTNDFSPPTNQMGTASGGLMQWSMSGDAFR